MYCIYPSKSDEPIQALIVAKELLSNIKYPLVGNIELFVGDDQQKETLITTNLKLVEGTTFIKIQARKPQML